MTYVELRRFAEAFANGHLGLMLVFGDGGLGKSRCIHQAVGNRACWIEGTASPFGIYCTAYEHRGKNLVLDDVDGLYSDRNGLRLLKCLAQTEPIKRVSWQTDAPGLDRRCIPRSFTTTSNIAIIANRWRSLNKDVQALEDRGHILSFEPSPDEVHRSAADWYWDQEIFDFVGSHLYLTERPSLRTYIVAYERKVAGLDWRSAVLTRCLSGPTLEVAKLRSDKTFTTEESRAAAFVVAGHGCRATYFNHARRLRSTEIISRLKLRITEPPPRPQTSGDLAGSTGSSAAPPVNEDEEGDDCEN